MNLIGPVYERSNPMTLNILKARIDDYHRTTYDKI